MKKDLRIAINELMDAILYIDDVIQDTHYSGSTTLLTKKAIQTMTRDIVRQDADYAKQNVLENGYVDDLKRVSEKLGLLTETERKA